MAKYTFDNISKFSATMMFTALASSPFAFLTNGFLGRVTFFTLKKLSNFLANKGLIIANIGVDYVSTLDQQKDLDTELEKAITIVANKKGRLTDEEKKRIDAPVMAAMRRFVSLIN